MQQQLALQATALETAANAIVITDLAGTILWVNPAFTTTTGYAAEEVMGQTPRVLKSGKHDQKFYHDFWQTITSGKIWRGEFINRRKDGSLYCDEHTVTRVRSQAGKITHFIGIMNDVTERKQAEEDLRATHAQLRQLLEHSPAVIYALRVEGEIVVPHVVSENITQLLGFAVQETLSYEWWAGQLHPEDHDKAIASVSETLTYGTSRTEYRLRHKNGDYHWVEDNRRVIYGPSNQLTEIAGVWTDITERKRAEEVLHEVSQEEIARRKLRAVKELVVLFLLSALVFGVTWYFNLFHVPLHWIVQHEETALGEVFVGLMFLLLGFVWFGFRRWHDVQGQVIQQVRVEEALRKLHAELETRVQQRIAELARTNEALRAEITERQRVEQRIADEFNYSHTILEASPLGIITYTAEGDAVSVNSAAAQIMGGTVEALKAQNFRQLESWKRDGLSAAADQALKTGQEQNLEARYVTSFGKKVWLSCRFVPFHHEGRGHLLRLFSDITERKRAEEVLRESERRFREMLENVTLIAMTLDKNGTVTFCNDYLLQLTGWKREEIIGADWFAKFIPEANPEVKKAFFETVEAGDIPPHYENPIKTRSGELREIVWSNPRLRDASGNIIGTASIGEDVTERKRAERRAAALSSLGQRLNSRKPPQRRATSLWTWPASCSAGTPARSTCTLRRKTKSMTC